MWKTMRPRMMPPKRVTNAAFLAAVMLLAACAQPLNKQAVGDFAEALNMTAAGADNSFEAVEVAALRADQESKAVDYMVEGKADLVLRDRVLSSDILEPRKEVFEGLEEYAQYLVDLASGAQLERLNEEAVKAGQKLQSLDATFGAATGTQTISAGTLEAGQKGIHALGAFLIDSQTRRTLAQAVTEMDPNIQAISELLRADIGSPDKREGGQIVPGTGLRGLLSNSTKEQIDALKFSLQLMADDKRVDRSRRYEAYHDAIGVAERARKIDDALAEVQKSLDEMVKAHAELVAPESPAAIDSARIFLKQAHRIGRLVSKAY
jgi:hypothetical protein